MATFVVNGLKADMTKVMMPGLVTLVLHFMAMAATADAIVSEKESGVFDRGLACGLSVWQILLSQVAVQTFPTVAQLCLSLAFYIYFLRHLISLIGTVRYPSETPVIRHAHPCYSDFELSC